MHCNMLRHWKSDTKYFKNKHLPYIQKLLGHKSLKTTLNYIQLKVLPQNEKYVCEVSKNIEESIELIEAGFDYFTDIDFHKLFQKRKTSYLGSESFHGGPWSSLD